MINRIFPQRFALLKSFSLTYLIFASVIRLTLYVLAFSSFDFSIVNLLKIIGIGCLFDLGSLSYIILLYSAYLLIVPAKYCGSRIDKIITYFVYFLFLFFLIFTFLAEVPFWEEYNRRFNFIAIDYLLYTYEVIENINQLYPLPILISVIALLTYLTYRIKKSRKVFEKCFSAKDSFLKRLIVFVTLSLIVSVFHFGIQNTQAEVFDNVNENEIAKSGIYSFFAAYKTNELDYNEFYDTYENEAALFSDLREKLKASNDSFITTNNSIQRIVKNDGIEKKPNVIFVGMESMSASFMKRYGSVRNITPVIDSIHNISIAFTRMYATGTRTVRGLEAVSLSVPPTPGRSIVKRSFNDRFFTIGEVFKQKGYSRTFITGGDAYFDNMANYFSYNDFDILDRSKKSRSQDELPTERTQIGDEEITFENAWGACDHDIYDVVINKADKDSKSDKPFFYMFMTNSNHSPYTYPDGIVDTPSGTGRTGAVTYADEAFKYFIDKSKDKPWFKNTVFVISADHCANSAGRTEIEVKRHHIPTIIFNLKGEEATEVDKLSSQIDIFPTLFGYLNWTYKTNLFGMDISKMSVNDERAFIANHRKLGLLKKDRLLLLEAPKKHSFYDWDAEKNTLTPIASDSSFLKEAVSYYQSAFELLKNDGLSLESVTK